MSVTCPAPCRLRRAPEAVAGAACRRRIANVRSRRTVFPAYPAAERARRRPSATKRRRTRKTRRPWSRRRRLRQPLGNTETPKARRT